MDERIIPNFQYNTFVILFRLGPVSVTYNKPGVCQFGVLTLTDTVPIRLLPTAKEVAGR